VNGPGKSGTAALTTSAAPALGRVFAVVGDAGVLERTRRLTKSKAADWRSRGRGRKPRAMATMWHLAREFFQH